MARRKAKASRKAQTQYSEALRELAHRLGKQVDRNGEFRAACPLCGGSDNATKLRVSANSDGTVFPWCYGCEAHPNDILAAWGVRKQEPFNPGPLPDPVIGIDDFHQNIPTEGIALDVYLAMLGLGPEPKQKPAPRPQNARSLPPVTPRDSYDYLLGMDTAKGARIAYQHGDGRKGEHTRAAGKQTRNPGITGEDWQVRRWNPVDVDDAPAIIMAEGEKDAATFALRGYIAFSAPRGAASLAQADFAELVHLHRNTSLPVVLAFDKDDAGQQAERRVAWLLGEQNMLTVKLSRVGPEKGSIADLPVDEMDSVIATAIHPSIDMEWLKPPRPDNLQCIKPRYTNHSAHSTETVYRGLPCGQCIACEAWEATLHIERCAKARPALALVFDNIGEADDTLDGCILDCETFRRKWLDSLRRTHFPFAPDSHAGENGKTPYMTIATRNPDTYRGRLVVFLADPDPDRIAFNPARVEWEQRKLDGTVITVRGIPYPNRDVIEELSPPTLTFRIDAETLQRKGKTENKGHVNAWTSGGDWPTWTTLPSLYDLDDGVEADEPAPDAMPVKNYRRTFGFSWNTRQTVLANLLNREEYAYQATCNWMRGVYLTIEDLDAIDKAEESGNAKEVIADIPGYRGPTALLRDVAAYQMGRNGVKWRKAFMPVLAMIGGAV